MPISDDHPSGTRLLTRQEAAERLSMCIDSIDNLRRAGELASVKIGKSRRILESSLEELIERKADRRTLSRPKRGRPSKDDLRKRAEKAAAQANNL
jgi:excisionase family DNA binding protein